MILSGHSAVDYVTFNHRGDLLATTGWDKTLRLWDPLTGKQLVRSRGEELRSVRMINGWGSYGKSLRLAEVALPERAARSRSPHTIFRASISARMAG